MFSMPTSKYVVDADNKVNLTLQSLYAAIASDINRMSTDGLVTTQGVPWACWCRAFEEFLGLALMSLPVSCST